MTSDFDALRKLLSRNSGLSLDAEKAYLAESRLQPIMQRLGLGDLGALVKRLLSGADAELLRDVVDAMTTNETFFFRDRVPFENFRLVILPKSAAGKEGIKANQDLVRRLFDRPGAIFACHAP